MSTARLLAFVLAGGEGRRLRPLTEDRAKPAVDLGQGYRIVDCVLANLVNSGVRWIYVLVQYKPGPLLEHLARTWRPELARRGCRLVALTAPPDTPGFRGTADAVRRNLHLLAEHEPDAVAVFAADHVYRMDLRPMTNFHRAHDADVTVAARPVAIDEARAFGVIRADAAGRITEFQEKPARPAPMRHRPQHAFASMGNYLFEPVALVDLLEDAAARGGFDFGHDVLPHAVESGARVFAYDFTSQRIPGLKPYEEPAYWRDVGTVQALAAARRDLEGPRPRFDPDNPAWPLRPRETSRAALVEPG
ncbi:MAG TPA: sugar phosphate nucleotidyltransferase [Burkholderiales bacterium]|nr:sugar phosphate nucleotidyltransferase [Burkholderiales bacterium]